MTQVLFYPNTGTSVSVDKEPVTTISRVLAARKVFG